MRGWHIRVYTRSKNIRDFPSLYVLRPINCAAIKQHPANLVNLLPGVTSAVYPMGVSLDAGADSPVGRHEELKPDRMRLGGGRLPQRRLSKP